MSDQMGSQFPTAAPRQPQGGGGSEPHHLRRMFSAWVVIALVGDLIWWFIVGPHVPPGAMSDQAAGAQFDFNVLVISAMPVVLAVWIYFGYAAVMWRASKPGVPEPVGGPKARDNMRVSVTFISITAFVVLFAFVFGTYFLIAPAGAGGGEGPNPVWKPTTKHVMPIQVIGQQWKFTFRYPTYGGMETNTLVLPNNTEIAFHVTSLDVIHSFWAYQIGVKADANPQVDNVAYAKMQQLGTFTVRCSELCGIWHGAMFDYGKVVTKPQFRKWALATEKKQAANTKLLPPFAWTYSATANGATGVTGVNTSGQSSFGPTQKYGATPAKNLVRSNGTPAVNTTT